MSNTSQDALPQHIPGHDARHGSADHSRVAPGEIAIGVIIGRAEEQITAILADETMAPRLKVKAGAPLLMITRTVFDTDDRAVEHLVAIYPPDRYKYSVSLGQ